MKSNWKMLLMIFAIISVASLGGIFLAQQFRSDQNDDLSIDRVNGNQGDVAGATTISNDDYLVGLAKALTDKGMVFYCSYQDPACKTQKELFGESSKYLDYVECDPTGENANSDECAARDIVVYPTWIYDGQKYTGYQPLSALAETINYSQ